MPWAQHLHQSMLFQEVTTGILVAISKAKSPTSALCGLAETKTTLPSYVQASLVGRTTHQQ